MLKEVTELYRGAGRFALACPLLFAVPVVAEFAQHAGEFQIGMYRSFAEAQAIEAYPLRMGLGVIKTVALFLTTYWFARFLHSGSQAAATIDGRTAHLFAPVLLWGLGWSVASLWGGPLLETLGVPESMLTRVGVAAFAGLFLFELLLAPWKTGAALGDARFGFLRSIRMTGATVLWGLGFFLVAVLPPMVLHYALGLGAIGRPPALVWTMLTLDSLLVGYLAAVLAGTNYFIARRVLAKHGLALEMRGPQVVPGAATV